MALRTLPASSSGDSRRSHFSESYTRIGWSPNDWLLHSSLRLAALHHLRCRRGSRDSGQRCHQQEALSQTSSELEEIIYQIQLNEWCRHVLTRKALHKGFEGRESP